MVLSGGECPANVDTGQKDGVNSGGQSALSRPIPDSPCRGNRPALSGRGPDNPDRPSYGFSTLSGWPGSGPGLSTKTYHRRVSVGRKRSGAPSGFDKAANCPGQSQQSHLPPV